MDIILGPEESVRALKTDGFRKLFVESDFIVLGAGPATEHGCELRYDPEKQILYIKFGTIFYVKPQLQLDKLIELYEEQQLEQCFQVDGDFLFFVVNIRKQSICAVTHREGIMPVYYRRVGEHFVVTTACHVLFQDFDEQSVNWESVNDYLRFGCLLGEHTLSKNVRLIQGGSIATFSDDVKIRRIHRFFYEPEQKNVHDLMEEIWSSYLSAVRKRLDGVEKDTCVFLSGGLDSRFLLGALNSVCETHRVAAYSFGQENSDEVFVAEQCAALLGNPFFHVRTNAEDFVSHAEEYERLTCGADVFQQGYIIGAAKQVNEKQFMTGFVLDAILGGTFLNEESIMSDSKPSDFIKKNTKALKMNVFTKDELVDLSKDRNSAKLFEADTNHLTEETEKYDGIPVEDAIQAFGVENRAKNLVLWRETVPAKSLISSYPSTDLAFLQAVRKIPAKLRQNHSLYRELFNRFLPQYARIIYNNTIMPAIAPYEFWKQGAAIEGQREKAFAEFQKQYNLMHSEKIYYPHYYSDFEGYSRYNPSWLAFFDKYLGNPDAFIYQWLFEKKKVDALLNEHRIGQRSRRKQLVYLASLECFFQIAFFKRHTAL